MNEPTPMIPLDARIEAVRSPLWASTAHLTEILQQLQAMNDDQPLPMIRETLDCNPKHADMAEALMYAAAITHTCGDGIFDILIDYLKTMAERTTIN